MLRGQGGGSHDFPFPTQACHGRRMHAYTSPMKKRAGRSRGTQGEGRGDAGDVDRQYLEVLDDHYRMNWGAPKKSLKWARGPVDELPRDFSVQVFARKGGLLTLATRGLGSVRKRAKSELFMIGT